MTPYLVHDEANLGEEVFLIWGATCAACISPPYFFIYETMGLSLEQVDKMMEETTPWKSALRSRDGRIVGSMDMEAAPGTGDEEKQTNVVPHSSQSTPHNDS
jgi:SP family sugar:H+ symporter-like MFS transporter